MQNAYDHRSLLLGFSVGWLSCCAVSAEAQKRRFVSGSRLLLGTATRLSASVRAADVDGDGDADLVVANGRHWPQQNFLFLNQSRGRFNVARPLGVDLSTSHAGEFADFVVANSNQPNRIFISQPTNKRSQ